MAQNHLRAAETAGSTDTASAARRAQWHLDQAQALVTEADASHVDLRQILNVGTEPPDGDERPDNRSNYRRAADTHLERNVRDGLLHSEGAEAVTAMMEHGHPGQRGIAAMWAAAAGDPAYERCVTKILSNPGQGHLDWTPDEHRAYQAAQEARAWLEGVPSAAGYLVPLVIDPAVLLTNAGVNSPLRSISRVEQITTDAFTAITSAGTTAEWVGEAVEVAQMTPTIAAPSIPVHQLSVFVKASIPQLSDSGNRASEAIRTIIADPAVNETEAKYALGDGVAVPRGVVTALSTVTASCIASGTAEVVSGGDPALLQNSLAARWQSAARFVGNLTTLTPWRSRKSRPAGRSCTRACPWAAAAEPCCAGRCTR